MKLSCLADKIIPEMLNAAAVTITREECNNPVLKGIEVYTRVRSGRCILLTSDLFSTALLVREFRTNGGIEAKNW